MIKYVLSLLVIFYISSVSAQGVSQYDIKKIKDNILKFESFSAKQNVITHGPLSAVAASRSSEENFDRDFTHVIKRGFVTNQERSGRCWLFAGLNVVRYDASILLGVSDFELSENYLFFYHKFELSNYVFESAITGKMDPDDPGVAWLLRNGLSDGGYWDMFVSLINKYGMVPKSVMPETIHSSNTADLNSMLDRLVKLHVAKIWELRKSGKTLMELRSYKLQALGNVYKLLALMLGMPPDQFKWRYTDKNGVLHGYSNYTPKSFAKAYIGNTLRNKVHLMSDPSLSYYNRFNLKNLKNVIEDNDESFLNVPMDALLETMKKSVLADRPVWFGSDVGRYANFKSGVLDVDGFDYEKLFGFPIEISKADRLKTYASAATHAMVLFGVDLDAEKPIKWLVENSWGMSVGDGGYLIMTTKWFEEYGFDAVIDRSSASPQVLSALSGPVIELPAWHHLWVKE